MKVIPILYYPLSLLFSATERGKRKNTSCTVFFLNFELLQDETVLRYRPHIISAFGWNLSILPKWSESILSAPVRTYLRVKSVVCVTKPMKMGRITITPWVFKSVSCYLVTVISEQTSAYWYTIMYTYAHHSGLEFMIHI